MKITAEVSQPVIEILKKLSPESSMTTLRSWLKEGRVTIDDVVEVKGATIVQKGQQVTISTKRKMITGGVEILYEDSHFVVINKPEGLLSVATNFQSSKTAHAYLKEYYHPNKVFVVHRLDQDTSGVMLFALNEECYRSLKQIFESHELQRRYCAIVEGTLAESEGTWQSYLYEDKNYVVHSSQSPSSQGELAITHFKAINRSPKYTLLELVLETGKKNQIRVHCKDSGCSIVGDKKYGAKSDPLRRLCLHAFHLSFQHPMTKKEMVFTAPIPSSFHRLVPKYA